MVNSMENCNVCGDVVVSGSGVFISGILKNADVFGCQDCKTANDNSKLVDKIRIIQEKYHQIIWFNYVEDYENKQGHRFVFGNKDEIRILHTQGDCSMDDLVEYIESDAYNDDVSICTLGRKEHYQVSDTPYPSDPFTAKNWW